ncbi:MAG: hypothetical protein JNL82_31445 [Myxococcales bacterium]|nr:hypothetical protein [Myxococcales bacterium]
MDFRTSSTLALSFTVACTIKIDDDSGTPPDTSSPGTDTGGTSAAPPTSGTTAEAPTSTTEGVTTTSGTTGEPTTGELPPDWCNGFEPDAPYTLTIDNGDLMAIEAMGSLITLECGGQGSLMFPIYPHFGGFIPPNSESVSFSVTLDVEGFNVGPSGHFFETIDYSFEVDCSYDTYGYDYSNSFLAMFPPDAIPDITAVDGKPGVLHVTLHAPMMDIEFTADVTMRAKEEDFGFCGYSYGTDTDTGSDTGSGSDTGGTTGGSTTG